MIRLDHSVRRQTLAVQCDSAESAMALRPHLADFNRSDLVPIIERVLSEAAVAGRQVRIERLEVNLGTIPLSEFKTVVPARLCRELKDALERALYSARHSPASGIRDQPENVSRFEAVEWYLLHGNLPFWAPPAASFSLGSSFAELAREDPASLARLVRQAGRHTRALERMVLQLTAEELRRLVSVLEPEHAALILAYVFDLGAIHREEPIAARNEALFDRLTWLLVLSYLVREAGSQFNRRMFVESLIRGFAAEYGMDYRSILTILQRGLERTLGRYSLQSSLPAVIRELLDDSELDFEDPPAAPEELGSLGEADVHTLARLVHRYGSRREWLERLVRVLDEKTLIALIGALEPEHAAVIVAFLLDVREVHRSDPVLAMDESQFARLLWQLALTWLVHERGSQFNRKSFFLSLTQQLGRLAGIDPAGILATLRLGLSKARLRAPLTSSLPAIVAELLDDLGRSEPDPHQGSDAQDRPDEYDLAATLREYFDSGVLPWTALLRDPSLTSARALARFPDLPVWLIETVLARDSPVEHRRAVLAAVRQMSQQDVRRLVSRMLPSMEDAGSPVAEAFRGAVESAASPESLYADLIVALLQGSLLDFDLLGKSSAAAASHAAEPADPAGAFRVLKPAIVAGLVSATSSSQEPAVPALLEDLLRQDAGEGRIFLGAILDRAAFRESLVRRFTPESFQSLVALLYPRGSGSLRELLAAFKALPVAERPSVEATRSAVLNEILRLDSIHETGPDFFRRVLQSIFPIPLPARVREALLASLPEQETVLRASLDASAEPRPGLGPFMDDGALPADRIFELLEQGYESGTRREALILALDTHLEDPSNAGRAGIFRRFADPRIREKMPRILPESTLARLVRFLAPGQSRTLLQAAGILGSAWARASPDKFSGAPRELIWGAVLELVAGSSVSIELLVRMVLRLFSEHLRERAMADSARSQTTANFMALAIRSAEEAGHSGLRRELENERSKPEAADVISDPRRKTPASQPSSRRLDSLREEYPEAAGEAIYIPNAGLVLVSPFLPHLFSKLDMLTPDDKGRSRWRDRQTASRAVHLLQYLVDERTSAPEPLLVLNKLLCGLPSAIPVERGIELTPAESETCSQLLQSATANWTVISSTSVEGLRETFLQREGRLQRGDGKWQLHVQRKTVDVLVDRIPWSFKLIFHDWMTEPIHVTW